MGSLGCGVVEAVTRSLKEWARRCGLIGTCDGMINSYAFTLLTIYFLQTVGVLPNLQRLAENHPPFMVEGFDTRFVELEMPVTVMLSRARPHLRMEWRAVREVRGLFSTLAGSLTLLGGRGRSVRLL